MMFWKKKKEESTENQSVEGFDPLIDRTGMVDDRYLNQSVSIHNWQVAFRLICIILTISVAFNGYNMFQGKYIPVVIAIDSMGQKLVVGPVTESKPVDLDRAIYREIIDFVEFSRWISSDAVYQKRLLQHVATRLRVGSRAAKIMNEFHTIRPPYETGKMNTIAVENVVPLKQSDKTYSVEWTEVRRSPSGELLSSEKWKGLISISLDPSNDRASVLANPLGFYIDDIDWQKVR